MTKPIDSASAPHYIWGNNCDSWVLADNAQLSIKQESMPGGTKEKLHFHNSAQQFFYILKGTATFYIDDDPQLIMEKQGLLVAPATRHYIANETNAPVEFLVISQPSTNNDRNIVRESS
ncbi:MAG: cupin domain-containing protein [Ferruginibacter sp.]